MTNQQAHYRKRWDVPQSKRPSNMAKPSFRQQECNITRAWGSKQNNRTVTYPCTILPTQSSFSTSERYFLGLSDPIGLLEPQWIVEIGELGNRNWDVGERKLVEGQLRVTVQCTSVNWYPQEKHTLFYMKQRLSFRILEAGNAAKANHNHDACT